MLIEAGLSSADVQPRARRSGAKALDVVDDAFGRQAQLLSDGANDARVRLVVDEQVDVPDLQAVRLEHLRALARAGALADPCLVDPKLRGDLAI
jgi:hypothetical protein